jgi:GntR family transcriptional regulator
MPAKQPSIAQTPKHDNDALQSKDAESGPLYKRVVESLRKGILEGVYPIGSHLPTEAELSEAFEVSRQTIREALRHLRADGLISSKQGSGSTVMGVGSPRAFIHELGSISDLVQYASAMTFRVVKSEMMEVDGELAGRLRTEPGTKWLRIEGFRHANTDGALVCMTIVYVPAEFAGVGRLVGHASGAIYELIEARYGVRIAEVEQTVRGQSAPPSVSKALGAESGSAVVEVIRVYRLQSGKTAEVAINLYPPERFSMTMKLRSRQA